MMNSQNSGSSSRGRPSSEERLVNDLKAKIHQLDPGVKSALKESLYRISRNTNNRVRGSVPDTLFM